MFRITKVRSDKEYNSMFDRFVAVDGLGPLLLTWININISINYMPHI